MVHRRRQKLQAPPGLDEPYAPQHELTTLQRQVGALQEQVDLLSKIFVFIDVEALCTKLKVFSLDDGFGPPVTSSSIEFHFEDAFAQTHVSDNAEQGTVCIPPVDEPQAYAVLHG